MPPIKRAPIKATAPTGAEEPSGQDVENADLPEEEPREEPRSFSAEDFAALQKELADLRKRADDSDARVAATSVPSDDPKEAVQINLEAWLKAKQAARPDVDFSELADALDSEDWNTVRDVSAEFLANNGGKELESLRPLLADYRRAYTS